MDTKGVVNIDYIVNLALMDIDDYSLHYQKKFMQYVILGFQDLNLYVMQSVKVAYLPVDSTKKTADLPDDYITYTKIGYNNGGRITTFTLNDDLMLAHQTDDCGNPVNDNTMGCTNDSSATLPYFGVAGYYYSPHYRNGQWVGELYGGAGGRNADGYYRIDKERRKIVFSSEMVQDEIILEYKSSGVSGDGSTVVPREYTEALRAYVHWQRKEYNDKVAQSEKERLKQRYWAEYEKVKDLEVSFTIEEYFDSTRSTYKLTPKR